MKNPGDVREHVKPVMQRELRCNNRLAPNTTHKRHAKTHQSRIRNAKK